MHPVTRSFCIFCGIFTVGYGVAELFKKPAPKPERVVAFENSTWVDLPEHATASANLVSTGPVVTTMSPLMQNIERVNQRLRELRVKEFRGALFEAYALDLMRKQLITLDVDGILDANRQALKVVSEGKSAEDVAIMTEAVDAVEATILKELRYRKTP